MAIENFRREVDVDVSGANRSMGGKLNESSFYQVPTMMDEQPQIMQINRPMVDQVSDVIGEEDS